MQAPSIQGSTSLTQETIADAFKGKIRPVEVSTLYKGGLLLVAVVMVLLPLLYLALIALVGYLRLRHTGPVYRDERHALVYSASSKKWSPVFASACAKIKGLWPAEALKFDSKFCRQAIGRWRTLNAFTRTPSRQAHKPWFF